MILVIEKQFERLEQQRKQLLEDATTMTHVQLTYRPEPTAWCILEVFVHLMTAETNGLRYMEKKLQGDLESMERSGMTAQIRAGLLNGFLRLPIKYKAPEVASFEQREYYDLKEIRAEWDELRAHWHEFLDQFDKPSAEKLIFKHPIAGRFNILQTLKFMYEHVDHHVKQVERIKSNPNFPKY